MGINRKNFAMIVTPLFFSATIFAAGWVENRSDILCETESTAHDGPGLLWFWNDTVSKDATNTSTTFSEIKTADVFSGLDAALPQTPSQAKTEGIGMTLIKNPHLSMKARLFPLKLIPKEEGLLGTHRYNTEPDSSDPRTFFLHDGAKMATGGYLVGVSETDLDKIQTCFVVPQRMRSSEIQSLLRDSVSVPNLSWKCGTPNFMNSDKKKSGIVFDKTSYDFGDFSLTGAQIIACREWFKKHAEPKSKGIFSKWRNTNH